MGNKTQTPHLLLKLFKDTCRYVPVPGILLVGYRYLYELVADCLHVT
jgi:hypothetical protein